MSEDWKTIHTPNAHPGKSSLVEAGQNWWACDYPERMPTRQTSFNDYCPSCIAAATAYLNSQGDMPGEREDTGEHLMLSEWLQRMADGRPREDPDFFELESA